MNLTGVIGDARKRLEAEVTKAPFDVRSTCIVCGERGVHTHAVAFGKLVPSKAA